LNEQGMMTFQVPIKDRLEIRFMKFHKRNPMVFIRLAEMALNLKDAGHTSYGMASLWEVLRYEGALQTVDGPWKLNNDYRAPMARLIERECPELKNFFRKRKSCTDRRSQ